MTTVSSRLPQDRISAVETLRGPDHIASLSTPSPSAGNLAEPVDELVGLAADHRVEHELGVVVSLVPERRGFTVELEARRLEVPPDDCRVDTVQLVYERGGVSAGIGDVILHDNYTVVLERRVQLGEHQLRVGLGPASILRTPVQIVITHHEHRGVETRRLEGERIHLCSELSDVGQAGAGVARRDRKSDV